jgi:hypothetical protein
MFLSLLGIALGLIGQGLLVVHFEVLDVHFGVDVDAVFAQLASSVVAQVSRYIQ